MIPQPFLGTGFLGVDTFHIDILGPFYRVSIDDDRILDVDKTAGDGSHLIGILCSALLLDPHFADVQKLARPGVTFHKSLVTFQSPDDHEFHITLIKLF